MSAESICDGCGKRAPMLSCHGRWLKPDDWFERTPFDRATNVQGRTITACSRECIEPAERKMRPGEQPMTLVVPL